MPYRKLVWLMPHNKVVYPLTAVLYAIALALDKSCCYCTCAVNYM